uniref:RNA polymerase sigma-70 factor n=1 Tax=uncultured Draconibacterium sp. TaxID=1573823 RepID=UPI003216DDBA
MIKGKNQKDIVNMFTQGSERAFERLFQLYFPRLISYANTFLYNRQEAEDLVQDVFVQIWNLKETIDTERQFSSFLFTLVRNRCLNSLKKKVVEDKFRTATARMISEELYLISFEMEDDFVSMEEKLNVELEKVIAEMPDRCQVAFRLKWLEGKKIREIAEEMSISTTMVDKHLAKGLQIAREKLSPDMFLFLFISKG